MIPRQTASTLTAAMLAMVLYPEAQKKAQLEIDMVTGAHRLPDYSDRASMPYVEAFYRELMRWSPTTPVGEQLYTISCDSLPGSGLAYLMGLFMN